MPLHEGHVLLFDVASALVDELVILVCTRDCEPINGQLRYEWVCQSVKSNVRVLHLNQDIPQEPADHPDFWAIWRSTIQRLHPEPINMVFGSETYVVQLAKELDAKPFIVDPDREVIPVSSTMIRNDCRTNWAYIPQVVRPYYQKRICILGPESTGKSTLCTHLAQAFNTGFIPEYGRTYDAIFRQGENWSAGDFTSIAKGHIALGKEISKRANFICLEDTDLLQTIVWAEYLLGSIPPRLQALLSEWHPAHFYILLKPDVAWVDDGTRYSGENKTREWFFHRLQSRLEDMGITYRVIGGSDREARTISAVDTVADFIE